MLSKEISLQAFMNLEVSKHRQNNILGKLIHLTDITIAPELPTLPYLGECAWYCLQGILWLVVWSWLISNVLYALVTDYLLESGELPTRPPGCPQLLSADMQTHFQII